MPLHEDVGVDDDETQIHKIENLLPMDSLDDEYELTPEQVRCKREADRVELWILEIVALARYKDHHEPDCLMVALRRIAGRATNTIRTRQFLERSLDRFLDSSEHDELVAEWEARRERERELLAEEENSRREEQEYARTHPYMTPEVVAEIKRLCLENPDKELAAKLIQEFCARSKKLWTERFPSA